jgi:hypothetical protein
LLCAYPVLWPGHPAFSYKARLFSSALIALQINF